MIFLDMDGVLADFDSHHEGMLGRRPSREADDVDWTQVRAVDDFYLNIPPMADMDELWRFVSPYEPAVLTGVPNYNTVPDAAANKRAWIRKHIGPHVTVICCRSKDKCLYAKPGDILIDDWEKHRDLWLLAGGRWITHTSAADTIKKLRRLLA